MLKVNSQKPGVKKNGAKLFEGSKHFQSWSSISQKLSTCVVLLMASGVQKVLGAFSGCFSATTKVTQSGVSQRGCSAEGLDQQHRGTERQSLLGNACFKDLANQIFFSEDYQKHGGSKENKFLSVPGAEFLSGLVFCEGTSYIWSYLSCLVFCCFGEAFLRDGHRAWLVLSWTP